MKNIIYSILLLLIFSSCQKSSEEILLEKTENWIEKNTNNPKSYEFVDFDIIDTLNLNEKNDKQYQSFQNEIKNYKTGLEDIRIGLEFLDKRIAQGKADPEEARKVKEMQANARTKMDSLIKKAEAHKDKYFNKEIYRVRHKFRINNEYNAPMLNNYLFAINSNYEVLDALKDN